MTEGTGMTPDTQVREHIRARIGADLVDGALRCLPDILAAAMEQEREAGTDREFAEWLCGYRRTLDALDRFMADPSWVAEVQESGERLRRRLESGEPPDMMNVEEFAERYGIDLDRVRDPERLAYPWRFPFGGGEHDGTD